MNKKTPVIETPAVVQETAPKKKLNEAIIDKMSAFQATVKAAKMQGVESLEATDEIIQYLNPTGLNGAKFFIYDGIKVFPVGKTDEIEAEMNESLYKKLHGENTAFIENR